MKKLLITALLFITLSATTKEQEEFKYIEPKDNQLLFYTPDNETKISSYCDNYIVYYPKDGYIIPTLRLLGMSLINPEAPLAKRYFPKEAIRAAQEAYLQLENRKDIDTRSKFSTAALWGIKILDEKLGKDNDKLFDFLKNIYNDVAKACNERYTGGKREMFMIIKEGYQK